MCNYPFGITENDFLYDENTQVRYFDEESNCYRYGKAVDIYPEAFYDEDENND